MLEVDNVSFRYGNGPWVLRNVSFSIQEGERVGLIAPSGYGKSTLSKIIAGYLQPIEGQVLWQGKPLPKKDYCPVQLIYQHPEKAINPRLKMVHSLNEAWEPDLELLEEMGIKQEWLNRWPNELSGGELQRFCIIRALSPETKFLIADEMSTMLDVITQSQIWHSVLKIVAKRKMGLIAITHNQALAEKIATRMIDLSTQNDIEVNSRANI
ncbi:ABC transporter ATP-binding protein [Alkalibacterium gilvum]|uniref:ABC transporter ATP-binding protein n=1 Tax=Alkalibacterium gilvum TaxID=1130080 RepID=UPI003F90310F